MATIRLTIKEALAKRGITQKELAERTGLREATISNMARGYVDRVTLDSLARIAKALDIMDIRELIEYVPDDDDAAADG